MNGESPPLTRVRLGSRAFLFLVPGLLLGVAVSPSLRVPAVLGYDLAVLLLFALDALLLLRHRVHVTRSLPPRVRARGETPYTLEVTHEGPRRATLRVRDTAPAALDVRPEEFRLALPGHERRVLEAKLVPKTRGRVEFGAIFAALESALRLAAIHVRLPAHQIVRVMPEATLEAERSRKGPRTDAGDVVLRMRRAAQGTELESLREYVASDPLRSIDWKATAKRRHPVTRLYQPEQRQTVWLVLDASRTMAASIAGDAAEHTPHEAKTRFDVALEALLVLAGGALRAGDHVGALVFGEAPMSIIPPGRGRAHYRRLVDVLSEVHARPTRLDVRGLVGELEQRARKRSLLVFFTDLENESHSEAFAQHAHMLTRRHLVLCVSLDDAITVELAEKAPASDDDVFQRAAATDLLREREELTKRLRKRGVLVLETNERGLAQGTLDRYLELKAHARL